MILHQSSGCWLRIHKIDAILALLKCYNHKNNNKDFILTAGENTHVSYFEAKIQQSTVQQILPSRVR